MVFIYAGATIIYMLVVYIKGNMLLDLLTFSIIALFMGGRNIVKGIDILEKNKIPNYFDPKEAVLAMRALIR